LVFGFHVFLAFAAAYAAHRRSSFTSRTATRGICSSP
jgi:hypothetical protein